MEMMEPMERRGCLHNLAAGAILVLIFCTLPVNFAAAHHVLGRPAYSLNEDSNTPPSMQAEVRVGDYLVTYMVFPAFPRPESPGRINFYATRLDDGTPYQGKVTFRVRHDSWLSGLRRGLGMGGKEITLGVQPVDDNVFRQGFHFHHAGDYVVTAEFQADGETHKIDFPLRIGDIPVIGPLGVIVGLSLALLFGITLVQRRRAMSGKIRGAREAADEK